MKKKKEGKFLQYLKNLNKKEKYLLFISVLLFTFVILEEVFISPMNKKNDTYSSDVKKLTNEKNKIINTIRNKEKLQEELNKINIEYNKKLVSFPKNEKQADILKNYIDYSYASGVTLDSVNFNGEGDGTEETEAKDKDSLEENTKENSKPKKDNSEDIVINNVSTTLNGSYDNIIKFINYIEKDKRTMNIINVQIDKNSDGMTDVNGVSAIISVQYYNLKSFQKEKYNFNDGNYGKKDYFK